MLKKIPLLFLLAGLLSSCGKTPRIELKQTAFHLQLSATASEEYFGRVKHLAIDKAGNFYILDVDKSTVSKFNADGAFVKQLIGFGWGDGYINRPSSLQIIDTTLILHNLGSLQFYSLDGQFRKSIPIGGRGSVTVAPDGLILINRMGDKAQFGYCLETYDASGTLLNTFRSPRSVFYQLAGVDFAFAAFTPAGEIAYIPTLLDSAFLYDRSGKLLLQKKLEPVRNSETTTFVFHMEDLYVNQDGLFVLRVDPKLTQETIFCQTIDQYDFKFNRIRSFTLPQAVTIGIDAEPWAPWYHKFVVADNRFYLMVSHPMEHLKVFEPITSAPAENS
ncbi:hypothetical protein GX408_08795 [bacterium]|nr:hypothetical protein [bacterium]